jgi:hypothetical protein
MHRVMSHEQELITYGPELVCDKFERNYSKRKNHANNIVYVVFDLKNLIYLEG